MTKQMVQDGRSISPVCARPVGTLAQAGASCALRSRRARRGEARRLRRIEQRRARGGRARLMKARSLGVAGCAVVAAAGRAKKRTRRPTILCQLDRGMGRVVLSGTRARPAHAPDGWRPAGRVAAASVEAVRGGHQFHPRSADIKTAGREHAPSAGWEAGCGRAWLPRLPPPGSAAGRRATPPGGAATSDSLSTRVRGERSVRGANPRASRSARSALTAGRVRGRRCPRKRGGLAFSNG